MNMLGIDFFIQGATLGQICAAFNICFIEKGKSVDFVLNIDVCCASIYQHCIILHFSIMQFCGVVTVLKL